MTVVPASPAAKRALDLLFPEIIRDKGAPPQSGRILHLLTVGSFGLGPSVDPKRILEELRPDVSIIGSHPDWAEIFEMRVAKLENDIDYRELALLVEKTPTEKAGVLVERPLPDMVAGALEKAVESPFAKALQDKIRANVAARKYLVPQRSVRPNSE